ncbi:MAG: tetratricopeptide repeat protein [Akkermansiaceae bacterium]|nr:tetratricopeptide repeat protein [Armatimonadota bacterium]
MNTWHIRLFGSLRVSRGDEDFFRFSTRKTGALLAFLAFHADRRHTRDALCDLLWPDEPPQKSRARLRVALTSLRHQLEPPGVPSGSVIRSQGNDQIELVAESVATDVAGVERALQILSDPSRNPMDAQAAAGMHVVTFFSEPLLTGFYDDWVITERDRLNQVAVARLSAVARQVEPGVGLEFARHAARIDPLAEEPLFALLSLLAEIGQHATARGVFQAFRRRLKTELGAVPSAELQALAATLPEGREKLSITPPTPKVAAPPKPSQLFPLVVFPRRLPSYLTRFFGRETERQELCRALNESPLVTMTGPGGTGKTRLAVETARSWDGVGFFVPLAEVGDPGRIPAAICDALGEKTKGAKDGPDALLTRAADFLADATTPLLVLDNLEQVADSVGSLLQTLIERVPTLRLLVTSRLRIHLPGEREFPLSPLPVPPHEGGVALDEAARVASVALFLDRARAARPDFQITTRNSQDIVTICRMLEGNPLAIELVAARGGNLVPSQMREKLAERGNLLIADRRASPDDRHRSLYAAIDWSYQLLSPDLRRFFSYLSVFRGGFTAASAATVCESGGENVASEAIARLRAHSLVGSLADASEMRFSLLESLRTFGAEQLTDDEREAASERHAAWFANQAERFDAAINGPDESVWLERVDADLSNFRAAMEYDFTRNPLRALQAAGALSMYWNIRGRPTEGRAWLEQALAVSHPWVMESDPDSGTHVSLHRSRALHGAGTLAMIQGDNMAAQPRFEESLRLRRLNGDPVAIASTLNNLGLLNLSRQEWGEARAYLGESLAIRRTTIAAVDLAGSLLNLGVVEWERGDYAAAKPLCEEALALYQERRDQVGESQALNNLGTIALSLSDFAEAEARFEKSLAIKRIVGYPPGIAITLSNVGVAAMYQGRHATATACFEESLVIYRVMNARDSIASELRNLGETATYRHDWDEAYSLLAESLTIIRNSDIPDDIAGTLEGFALFAEARGEVESTARLFGAADALRRETNCPLYPSERVAVDKATAAAVESMGQDRFDRAFQDGATLSSDDAVEVALALKSSIASVASS